MRPRSKRVPEGWESFDKTSLISLLWAAADNIAGRGVLPTITAAIGLALAMAEHPRGQRLAVPDDLTSVLSSARSVHPEAERIEDFTPADPRKSVHWMIGSERLRIDPGLIEDPVAIFKDLQILAILDDEVVTALGFGIADLVEVALRRMDQQLVRLESCWRSLGGGPQTEALVTEAECALAAARLPGSTEADAEVSAVVESCMNPVRAKRALMYATVPYGRLSADLRPLKPLWGPVFACEVNDRLAFVPSSLILEGLDATANRVAARMHRRRRYRDRRGSLATARLGEAIRQLDADVLFPVAAPGDHEAIFIRPGERHVLALEIVSGGTLSRIPAGIQSAQSSLIALGHDPIWKGPAGPIEMAKGAEILPIVVVDGPGRCLIDTSNKPLVVGLSDLCDTIARCEDAVELWAFLVEVAAPPHIGCIAAPGLGELWVLWSQYGTINPQGLREDNVAVGWDVDLHRWDESALWDPYDATLTAAGLPSSAHATRRDLGRPDNAQIWSLREPRHARLVHTSPGLVVDVPLDEIGVLDPELIIGLADVMCLAAEQLPPFCRAVESVTGVLHLVLRANGDPPPPSPEWSVDDAWIAVSGSGDPWPVIEIACDHRLLVLLAVHADPATKMIAAAVTQALTSLGVDEAIADEAREAWHNWQAPFRVNMAQNVPSRPIQPAEPIRLFDMAKVHDRMAARMQSLGIEPGVYAGEQAVRICDRCVSPTLVEMLSCEVTRFNREDRLRVAANQLGALHAERRRESLVVKSAMSTFWADERRLASSVGQDVEAWQLRAAQLVFEMMFAESAGEERQADRIDWAFMLAIAASILDISQLRSQSRFGLQSMELVIEGDCRAYIRSRSESPYDLHAFDVLRRLSALRPEGENEPDVSEELSDHGQFIAAVRAIGEHRSHETVEFSSIRAMPDLPSDLVRVDESIEEHLGTGIDGILATLKTAGSLERGSGTEFVTTSMCDLVKNASEWSDASAGTIEAAVGLLTLRADELRSEGIPYWLVEKRRYRLTTRPFVEVAPGVLWVLPELATAAQIVFARYFSDGRLPWPDLPVSLQRVMEKYRQGQNRQLEFTAESEALRAGCVVRRGLTPAKAARYGVSLAQEAGEIDLLVGDTRRSRLWVIEVKDPQEPFAPHELQMGANDFRRRYLPKLYKKTDAIEAAFSDIAKLMELDGTQEWSIHPLFLTSRVELAAFDTRIDVTFVAVDDLWELLTRDELISKGHYVPGWARKVLRPNENN